MRMLMRMRIMESSDGSFENEALENEDRSTKHPNLENEALKSQNHCRLKDYNFKSWRKLNQVEATDA